MPLTEEERNAAVRRALFVFAAGGDLHRDPELDRSRPSPSSPATLTRPSGVRHCSRASDVLRDLDDPELAWRAYACGLLADALGEEDDMSEQRFDGEPEEPGDPLEEQEEIDSSDGEPWAKTSSGDADDVSSD